MKLSVEQPQLAEAVLFANGAVNSSPAQKNASPILRCVLVEASEGRLTITGTDLEIQNSVTIEANVDEPGAIALPSKKLAEIVKAADSSKAINISLSDKKATIRSGRSRFVLSGLSSEEFPEWPHDSETGVIEVDTSKLKQAISNCIACMANQDVRYYLNGMCFTTGDQAIEVASTDGHRLALKSVVSRGDAGKEAIIPRASVVSIGKLLGNGKDVELLIGDSQAVVKQGNLTIHTKLIDGKYPNYQRIIPHGNEDETVINRVELITAVKRALLLSNEKYRGIKMNITSTEISFTGNNPEQEESFEKIACRHSGQGKEIGVNGLYMLDAVSGMQGENITLLTGDPNASMMIKEDDLIMVVMPMRL